MCGTDEIKRNNMRSDMNIRIKLEIEQKRTRNNKKYNKSAVTDRNPSSGIW